MLDERFKDTIYLVEANGYERGMLWKEHHDKLEWGEDPTGIIVQIGELDNRPINLDFIWTVINGHRICFYHCISQVVDHRQIENWLGNNFPNIPKTNAMNFHHIYLNLKN